MVVGIGLPMSVEADDQLYALIRTSDQQVVGVGSSQFEGVENLSAYTVLPVSESEAALHRKAIRQAREREQTDARVARQQKAAATRQKLGLTPKEFDDLKDALSD